MKKRIVLAILVLVSLFSAVYALQPSTALAASPKDEICKGINTASGSGCENGDQLTGVIRNIVNIFSIIIGIFAVIMVMVSGFKYITDAGDSGNIASAKNTLIYAIIGLVVAALSQTLVKFVLDQLK
ncbi:MAG TPA: pilin [Candidatus Saccharimonadales bacterium]